MRNILKYSYLSITILLLVFISFLAGIFFQIYIDKNVDCVKIKGINFIEEVLKDIQFNDYNISKYSKYFSENKYNTLKYYLIANKKYVIIQDGYDVWFNKYLLDYRIIFINDDFNISLSSNIENLIINCENISPTDFKIDTIETKMSQ